MKSGIGLWALFSLLILGAGCGRKSPSHSGKAEIQSISAADIGILVTQSSQPYILINFFATWCKPCIKEIPELIEVKNDTAMQVDVLFVSLDDEEKGYLRLAGFLSKMEMDFRVYHMDPGQAQFFLRKTDPMWMETIPTNLIYDRSGRLIESTGMTDANEIRMIISREKHSRSRHFP